MRNDNVAKTKTKYSEPIYKIDFFTCSNQITTSSIDDYEEEGGF